MSRYTSPRQLLAALTAPSADVAPSLQEAFERPGSVCEVTDEDYFSFLEMLPPHFIDGSSFSFADGAEPYTLFWRSRGRYYAKRLTWAETENLAQLAGIPLPGGW